MARSPDLVGLTVLALLSARDSHPYEMQRFIVETHKDYVSGLPRSLYHAVDRLTRDELIRPAETVRDGPRPERTVYRITDQGRVELGRRLRVLIEVPALDRRTFVAAVSLLGCLPVAEARSALAIRSATVAEAVTGLSEQLAALRRDGLPELLVLELEYERAIQQAEQDWIATVLDRMDRGDLAWAGTVAADLLEDLLREPTTTEPRGTR